MDNGGPEHRKLVYEVDDEDDQKPPARAAAPASNGNAVERPAAMLVDAERDLRAKQDARSRLTLATAARPASNSRLMQMEEDALSKARGRGATQQAPSVPGAVNGTPASLQSLEVDLETKNRAYSGRSTVVNPSVAAATAAARRAAAAAAASAAQEQAHAEKGTFSQQENYRAANGRNEPYISAEVTRVAAPSEPPILRGANETARATTEPESASLLGYNQSTAGPGTTASVLETAPVANFASFQNQSNYDESSDVADVNPIEAFVAETNVVDAAGVAVVLDEEEEKQLEEKKLKFWLILGAICLGILIVVIVVPTVVLLKEDKREVSPTMAPSLVPSMAPSSAPTTVYFNTLESQLAKNSGSEVFNNSASPQFAAVKWMATMESGVMALSSDKLLQLYCMAVFYYALNGDNWKSCNGHQSGCSETVQGGNNGWLTNVDPCTWYVVTCDSGTVRRIQFASAAGNGLSGSLPYELFLLTSLESLFINSNSIKGTLPHAFKRLTNLQLLVLSSNSLTGSIPETSFGSLTQLQLLFLGGNSLNGTIPSVLGRLPLKDLRLPSNELTGTIPSELGSLSSLGSLYLSSNQLRGSIPAQIFSLSNLTEFGVYGNTNLTGTIPSTIAVMTKAVALDFFNTQIGGTLPEGLFDLTMLTSLKLNNASFAGTLSENFGKLNRIRVVDLSFNMFHGTIPTSFAALDYLNVLALQGNNLTGMISTELCKRNGTRYNDLHQLTVDCQEVSCKCCGCLSQRI